MGWYVVRMWTDSDTLFQINVGLGLVYNLRQHSGLIFQVYYKKHHKKQKTREFSEVIASGGRYDKLVGSSITALTETTVSSEMYKKKSVHRGHDFVSVLLLMKSLEMADC